MEATEKINEIRQQVALCTKCKLHLSRRNVVPGEGPVDCDIMFIGEAPGFHENEEGKPFVGAAGKLLDELLAHAGLDREKVFITNVVKCRPPTNRDPEEEELLACHPFLTAQMTTINPKMIVTLGRFSMAKFFGNGKVSNIHGHPRSVNGRLIVPMYHPAAALHQPTLRSVLLEDFSKLPGFINLVDSVQPESSADVKVPVNATTEQDKPEQNNIQQLNLFG